MKSSLTRSLLALTLLTQFAGAQEIDPNLYQTLRWRLVGPFRAGRVTTVAGVPGHPDIFYMGTPGGGVWKTTDAGNVWNPIFDEQHVASIGAMAVAESNPNIIYVGTGEQTRGNGVYRSSDAGATWTNAGLAGTHIITGVVIAPRNPNIVLVAAQGDRASGAERGVFKTTDGGKNWQKVLFKDDDTGAVDLNMSRDNPKVIFAVLRKISPDQPPGQASQSKEQNAAIFRSNDEGSTWAPISGRGLPTEPMGRVGIAVAPGTRSRVVYAIATQGFYRSEDGGESWKKSTNDPRVIGSGYFSRVFVDPVNPDVVYVAETSMYRSVDGGRTFEAFAGAPSGDDFHVIWIDPLNTRSMILGVDQGAVVSVDGGATWSSWYNQPTGQFYHVITDDAFPYYLYAAQQDSGTAAIASRSDYGEITYRDWAPTGGFEFSFMAPDPINPNYVYTGGWYGTVLRYDKTTGQIVHLFVRTPKYRTANMAPLLFSPQDGHILYAGAQFVMKTSDGGFSWQEISPDLTEKTGDKSPERDHVISTLAVSRVSAGELWAGTANGQIHVTRDGQSWQNVTPANLPERSSVSVVEASPHDAAAAYAVITAFQNFTPLIYRTRDYGKSWQPISAGLPDSFIARVIREDPVRKGLLYAGTETGVFVSFDDGDHWQPLQMNLPTSSVRDLAIHGNDLVAATFGRSLWILDDVSPLRLADARLANTDVQLLPTVQAIRARWDMNQDTPLPPETPAGKNPPDGAIIDYYCKSVPEGALKLSIYDAQNNLVREYSGVPPAVDNTPANVPSYWFAPPAVLTKNAGLNRFVWDLRYPAPKTLLYSYYGNHLDYIEYTLADHAVPGETPREQPQGPLVAPGEYTVVLQAGAKTYKQALKVILDPRVHTSQEALAEQLAAEKRVSAMMAVSYESFDQVAALRAAIAEREKSLAGNASARDAADALKKLDDSASSAGDGAHNELGLGALNRELARLVTMLGSGDDRPAAPLKAAVDQSCAQLAKKLQQWRQINAQNVPVANELLQKQNATPLPVASTIPTDPVCAQ